jgi:N-acetylglucosamine-6-phosphate deacetylase
LHPSEILPVSAKINVARLPDNTRLAGSIQPLSQMVRNLVFDCNIPIAYAVRCASLTPATVIGLNKSIGSIESGKIADLCILDKYLHVEKTIINGNIYIN